MKTEQREKARALRRDEGLSVKVIARRLGVSQSSVSRWVRDVPLTEEQRAILVAHAYNGGKKGRSITFALLREARVLAQEVSERISTFGTKTSE
jgi:transcriptional regulator with XRE-family HTH domain